MILPVYGKYIFFQNLYFKCRILNCESIATLLYLALPEITGWLCEQF